SQFLGSLHLRTSAGITRGRIRPATHPFGPTQCPFGRFHRGGSSTSRFRDCRSAVVPQALTRSASPCCTRPHTAPRQPSPPVYIPTTVRRGRRASETLEAGAVPRR